MSESESPKKEELIIQQKVYDMIMYAYPAIEQFPKAQKIFTGPGHEKMPG